MPRKKHLQKAHQRQHAGNKTPVIRCRLYQKQQDVVFAQEQEQRMVSESVRKQARILYHNTLDTFKHVAMKLASQLRRCLVLRVACCIYLKFQNEPKSNTIVLFNMLWELCEIYEVLRQTLREHLYKQTPNCVKKFTAQIIHICSHLQSDVDHHDLPMQFDLNKDNDGQMTRNKLCEMVGTLLSTNNIRFHTTSVGNANITHACNLLLQKLVIDPYHFGDRFLYSQLRACVCEKQTTPCKNCIKH